MDRFCDRLNEAIEKANISPAELSRRTGIREGAISCYRSGQYKAGQGNIHKLAMALNVSIPWLIGLTVDMEPTAYEKRRNIIDRVSKLEPDQLDKLNRLLDIVEGL